MMTAIILAGGKATRMKEPCDKAFLIVDGERIIDRQLKVLKKIFEDIIIVTKFKNKYSNKKWCLSLIKKKVKIIKDVVQGYGPLGGIYSGLMYSSSFYNFVVACDMPFINAKLIRYMIMNRDHYDIIIPRVGQTFHPLFGIYSKKCIPIIEDRLRKHKLKIQGIFAKLKTHFILPQEIEKFDQSILSLVNINTPADLVRLKKEERD